MDVLNATEYHIVGWRVKDIRASVAALAGRGVIFERYPWMRQDESGVWTAPGGTRVAGLKEADGNALSVSAL
jgi:hypothetical protein